MTYEGGRLTRRHSDTRRTVHRSRCNRNRDRRRMFRLCDGTDDDAVDFESANRSTRTVDA